ncbi:MAG: beta galactosidase jelly roll domain-containing protein, partial [Cyclobacteriaceae bacterium]|nr:beta galactosidase jelly roll domain-containing protein [Cyclobacteriaceae bacterium]
MRFHLVCTIGVGLFFGSMYLNAQEIPLPEHPRPDFQRDDWQNLNGSWLFGFDSLAKGEEWGWTKGNNTFSQNIRVPFPWGSALSGVEDKADIGWYEREVRIAPEWDEKRVFLTIGASDWQTSVWIDGQFLGVHEGGYVPFSFEIPKAFIDGRPHRLVIKADDKRRNFTLYGKQGYGNARGIWQTVYLEAR